MPAVSDLRTEVELRGLALPALRGTGGFFESKDPGDVAWGDLLLALFVRRGARFMRRNLGSAVPDQLFEPADASGAEFLQISVVEAVERQAPHITITQIDVDTRPKGLEMRILYRLTTDPATVRERLITFPKTFISNPTGGAL